MDKTLTIVMGQCNFLVGDVLGNAEKIIATAKQAKKQYNADLLVFPELALTGYPPEDLLLRPDLFRLIDHHLDKIKNSVNDIDLIIGYPEKTQKGTYNAAAYIHQGEITAKYTKRNLPNYGVFDEKRYFIPGEKPCVVSCQGVNIGLLICEDLWREAPCQETIKAGADIIICINASPYDFAKVKQREGIMSQHVEKYKIPIIYVHGVGGQDELLFDGGSLCMNQDGAITHYAKRYEEALFPIQMKTCPLEIIPGQIATSMSQEEQIYQALCLGLKDYVAKNGFSGVLLGLSGGIDSALTLAIAYDALGQDNVQAVMLPSRYTSSMSRTDAKDMAENLGIQYSTISIEDCFQSFCTALEDEFANLPADTTEENIQARCRGVILMALSNKTGKLLLTTGNKSEVAVGYATLYGDMCGGFSVLKDVPKTLVYRLANYRNQIAPIIPERIITRPPTAELAPEQLDQDSLPPYDILDQILERYVEQDKSIANIVNDGFDEKTVRHVIAMVDKNEYKRGQAAPGIRITQRAFGKERRYPITSGFSHDIVWEISHEKN